MQYAEQVYTQLQKMPEFLQIQVLDFVNFLWWKSQQPQEKIEMQEDYALGLAMEQAKHEPVYSREEALKMLEEDD
jgi:hypothetical protein